MLQNITFSTFAVGLTNNVMNNVYYFIPFWIMYVFLVTLHVQFLQSALGIGIRYRRLNNIFKRIHKQSMLFITLGVDVYIKLYKMYV